MANHIRQQIRQAAAALLAGLSSTGSHVFSSQYYPLANAELPALLIYTPEEDSSNPPPRCHPGELRRVITLNIEGVVTGTGNLADALDEIARQVEVKLATDFTFGGTCKSYRLMRTAYQARGGDSPQPVGSIVLTLEVIATTIEGAPDALS